MKSLLRFWKYVRPHLVALVVGVVFSIIAAVASATVAGMLKPMFNEVFFIGVDSPAEARRVEEPSGTVPEMPGTDAVDHLRDSLEARVARLARDWLGYDRSRAYIYIPIFLVASFFIRGLFTYLANFRFATVTLRSILRLRVDLFEEIQRQSLKFFHDHPTGLLIARVTTDVNIMQSILGPPTAELIRLLFSFVVLLAAATLFDWQMALVCVVVLPVTTYPVMRFARKIKRSTLTSQSRLADLADRIHETIGGRRVVRVFNTESFEIGRFRSLLDRMLHADRRSVKYQALTQPVIELIGALSMGTLAGFAGWRIQAGRLDPGQFMATLAALYWMYTILKRCARIYNELTKASAAAERVFYLLDLEREVVEAADAHTLPPFSSEVRFENVSFAYAGEPVLRSVNLTIRQGETVAIVGASGAGKTTMVNLVPRFHDVIEGAVRVDGTDVRDVTLASLREQIGLVTQEVVLFNDSVRNNIAYGHPDAPQEKVEAAARVAHAHGFVMNLPERYDEVLGEGGQSLSVGQRQRLSIARALLKDPPILILDEATSALDTESEVLVQEALAALMRERTTIVIAHRLSTVRSADRIVVLDRGRIAETGDHAELLRRDGLYARLHNMQFATDAVAKTP